LRIDLEAFVSARVAAEREQLQSIIDRDKQRDEQVAEAILAAFKKLEQTWLSVREVASYTRTSESTVKAAIATGALHASELEEDLTRWRCRRSDADSWLESRQRRRR
jgi:excisionase family DNA binding protein